MKALSLSLATLFALIATPIVSQANPATGPLWSCQIEADLEGFEGGFIVVVKSFEGTGEMRCQSVTGDVLKRFPVAIDIRGAGLGFGVSIPRNLRFVTGDVGVTQPGYLYGKYSVGISADGTIGDVGGSVGLNLSFSKRGMSFRGMLVGSESEGLLAAVTGSVLTIRPL